MVENGVTILCGSQEDNLCICFLYIIVCMELIGREQVSANDSVFENNSNNVLLEYESTVFSSNVTAIT